MSVFQELETCLAYLHLVRGYWPEIQQGGASPEHFRAVVRQLLDTLSEKASACTPEQALQWCEALREGPLACAVENSSGRLLGLFAERVCDALRQAQPRNMKEALRWMEFVEHCAEGKSWKQVHDCLCVVREPSILGEVARWAFDVLKSIDGNESHLTAEELRNLEYLKFEHKSDIWELQTFREALWVSMTNQKQCDEPVRRCLEETLKLIQYSPDEFTKWIDVYCRLEVLGVCVEAPSTAIDVEGQTTSGDKVSRGGVKEG